MNRIVLLIMSFVAGMIVACNDPGPTIPPDPSSLSGSYQGTYAYIFDPGGGPDTMIQTVLVYFTSTAFNMYADTAAGDYDPSVCFCRAFGAYALTDRVRIEDPGGDPIPDNCRGCSSEMSPYGTFVLEQPAGGLRLTSIDSTGPEWITRQLELTKLGGI